MINQASDVAANTGASLKSLVKLALQSRRATLSPADAQGDSIIIMGNGPSLRQSIDQQGDLLAKSTTMAVNFAAIAPEFAQLKPKYYILVDPHFFSGKEDANLTKLWTALRGVDWHMTLILPHSQAIHCAKLLDNNANITIRTINPVGIEGWKWLKNWAYASGRGMPRPRNVLIPAIMSALLMGYKNIYIIGADHSWMQTISVNSDNEVVSVQPHFYKDDQKEQKRVNSEYAGYHLHQIVYSFYVAFKSYHDIAEYAKTKGVDIYNATPVSFIDAFERRELSEYVQ